MNKKLYQKACDKVIGNEHYILGAVQSTLNRRNIIVGYPLADYFNPWANVTSLAKRNLIAEQSVSSKISCFHTFTI